MQIGRVGERLTTFQADAGAWPRRRPYLRRSRLPLRPGSTDRYGPDSISLDLDGGTRVLISSTNNNGGYHEQETDFRSGTHSVDRARCTRRL